jgi:hypothetical protein
MISIDIQITAPIIAAAVSVYQQGSNSINMQQITFIIKAVALSTCFFFSEADNNVPEKRCL